LARHSCSTPPLDRARLYGQTTPPRPKLFDNEVLETQNDRDFSRASTGKSAFIPWNWCRATVSAHLHRKRTTSESVRGDVRRLVGGSTSTCHQVARGIQWCCTHKLTGRFLNRPDLYSESERHLPERSGCFVFEMSLFEFRRGLASHQQETDDGT
jgi:hypothetical protein